MSEVKHNVQLDEVDGNILSRQLMENGSVEYVVTSPGDDPSLRIRTKGKDALKEIMSHWKSIHTAAHNAWRNRHFKAIEATDKEMCKRENDKQEKLPIDDGKQ